MDTSYMGGINSNNDYNPYQNQYVNQPQQQQTFVQVERGPRSSENWTNNRCRNYTLGVLWSSTIGTPVGILGAVVSLIVAAVAKIVQMIARNFESRRYGQDGKVGSKAKEITKDAFIWAMVLGISAIPFVGGAILIRFAEVRENEKNNNSN